MPRATKTVVHHDHPDKSPVWSAIVLLASLCGVFSVLSLFLANNHAWTDAMMRALPFPGAATSFAADPVLAGQLRIVDAQARFTTLGDQTLAVIVEARVVNDALIPVEKIVLEAIAYENEEPLRQMSSECGKSVSDLLLQRMPLEELMAWSNLERPDSAPLQPGRAVACQVAMPAVPSDVAEVSVRIASVEPLRGHRPPSFRLAE